ncbi:MAG: hypothetical protein M3430_14830 [Acidobacteriota bacterium]|nr:hypothetical protein [Acidobacteriota bacterium]
MAKKLDEKLETVVDRGSFLAFVKALIAERERKAAEEKRNPSSPWGAGVNGWEHDTIEGYLGAAVAYAEDSRGTSWEMPPEPSWKAFAHSFIVVKAMSDVVMG